MNRGARARFGGQEGTSPLGLPPRTPGRLAIGAAIVAEGPGCAPKSAEGTAPVPECSERLTAGPTGGARPPRGRLGEEQARDRGRVIANARCSFHSEPAASECGTDAEQKESSSRQFYAVRGNRRWSVGLAFAVALGKGISNGSGTVPALPRIPSVPAVTARFTAESESVS
jgi:hypothetical protein